MKEKISKLLSAYGLPRTIITIFIIVMLIIAPFYDNNVYILIGNVINRFGINSIIVLSMVPMVHAGCGLNFGLPLSIEAGLLGATISIELGFTGFASFAMAILIAIPFAIVFGLLYGFLLNKIKGGEMTVATYVGFSFVSLMCIAWTLLPFKSSDMVWAYSGSGLRSTINVTNYYGDILTNFLSFSIGDLVIPTGSILFFVVLALGIWAFLHTKAGTAMTAVGSNPVFAKAAGIDIDKTRTLAVVISSVLAAIGIIVYQQGFGYIQLYNAPFSMAMPAVAALLLGGAGVNKASISNVISGTILYQAIVTITPNVINSILHLDITDSLKSLISNGVILYALTRKTEGGKKK